PKAPAPDRKTPCRSSLSTSNPPPAARKTTPFAEDPMKDVNESSVSFFLFSKAAGFVLLFALLTIGSGCSTESVDEGSKRAKKEKAQINTTVPAGYRSRVVSLAQVSDESIARWRSGEWNSIAIFIDDDAATEAVKDVSRKLESAGLEFEYFFEIARNVKLAEEHPEWMASLQGHDEWRRLFPNFPAARDGVVAKVYPWVPICYEESFDYHVKRLERVLNSLPRARRVWLSDIQGAPSACGCGHPLCRWTGDYGPVHTAKPLTDSAAADFLAVLKSKFSEVEFLPVWATECEEEDEHEACGGVGCFEGICWKAWTRQLMAVEKQSKVIGVSCMYKVHERDIPRYGGTGAWIPKAIDAFQSVPLKKKEPPVMTDRLVAVLQGFDVSDNEIEAQLAHAKNSMVRGVLLVDTPIDQSWTPREFDVSSK
ncbi:MAG: hypothetical protein ACKV19_16245, partial [Verrucomicrobiales bacterium]